MSICRPAQIEQNGAVIETGFITAWFLQYDASGGSQWITWKKQDNSLVNICIDKNDSKVYRFIDGNPDSIPQTE